MKQAGISVVICTHNGKSRLAPTLSALFAQQVPSSLLWEIVIVDNASTDGTQQFCSNLARQANWPEDQFRVVSEPVPGLNYARKKGLLEAKFKYLLFCDDDNHLFPDYLSNGFHLLSQNEKIGVLGGEGIPSFETQPPQWFQQYAHSYAVGPQAESAGKLADFPAEVYGAGAFIRSEVLLKFYESGFSTITTDRLGNTLASGGDVEWCYILQLAGYEIWFHPSLRFYHTMPAGRLTWEYYLRLKKGIASGSASLFSYQFLLLHPGASVAQFRKAYVLLLLRLNALAVKHSIPFARQTSGYNLGRTILFAKAAAFRRNFGNAVSHFKQMKTFRAHYV